MITPEPSPVVTPPVETPLPVLELVLPVERGPVEVFPPALPLDVLAATGVHEVVYLLLAVAALAVMFGCLAVLSYRIHPRYKRTGK